MSIPVTRKNLKINNQTWPNILEECKNIFDEDPILELALAPIVKDTARGIIKPMRTYFFKKTMLPLWSVIKKVFHLTKGKINNIEHINSDKSSCVFCLTTTRENDFNSIYPVIKKTSEKDENIIIFTYNKVYKEKNNELKSIKNLSIMFFENILYNTKTSEILSSYKKAKKSYKNFIKNIKNQEISDFVKKNKHMFIFKIEELLIDSFSLLRFFENKKCRFIYSWGGYFPLSIVANKLKIRNIMIQHGVYTQIDQLKNEIQPPESSPHASDEIITWGKYGKQMLDNLFQNKLTDRIYPLGDPRQDVIINNYVSQKRDNKYYSELKLDPNKKTITYFSSTLSIDEGQPKERYLNPLEAIDKLYEKMNDKINIVIKLHPHETFYYLEKHLKYYGKIPIIKDEYPLYKILQHTDISVTVESSTLLESMIFKLPTIQLSLSKYGVRSDYYKHDASILIKKTDDFLEIIENITSDKYNLSKLKQGQKNFLENNFSNLGSATEKIVEHLFKN